MLGVEEKRVYDSRLRKQIREWVIPDKPGEYAEISKYNLSSDDSYQRSVNRRRIETIAAKFSWKSFGSLNVALRPDGEWMITDGKQRHAATMLRSDIDMLPCMVHEMAEVKDEAHAFLLINTNRRVVTQLEQYRAMVMDRDPAALLLEKLCKDDDREISTTNSSRRSVACVAALLGAIREDREALLRVFPIISELCGERRIHDCFVKGFMYIERRMCDGASLSDREVKRRLNTIGYDALLESAQRTATYFGASKANTLALGFIRAYNKGLRTNKLRYQSTENDE